MAGRLQQLSGAEQGIDRRRIKGSASPKTLYDLENGYIDATGAIVSRPGTVEDATLPAGTKGLCASDGAFLVFAHEVKVGMPAGYTCEVLTHPDDATQAVAEIHFSAPFLGYPYVVAEFEDGAVYHYWLQVGSEWAASTAYQEGDIVVPTTPNGLAYRAKRLNSPYPAWAAGVQRNDGDRIEPTTANGYYYEVTDLTAADTPSGTVEPTWPTEDGASVTEYSFDTPEGTAPPTTPTAPGGSTLPDDIEDRYCVVFDSVLDDGSLAVDAQVGDLHWCWTPEEGFTRQAIVAVGEMVQVPCVRVVLDDGSALQCSATTPFTDPAALADGEGWDAPQMLGHAAFNGERDVRVVVAVDDIGLQWVVPLDFGGRSFAAGEIGLVFSHNVRKYL